MRSSVTLPQEQEAEHVRIENTRSAIAGILTRCGILGSLVLFGLMVSMTLPRNASAADVIQEIEAPAAADVLSTHPTGRRHRHRLLMPPIGSNPGVVQEKRSDPDVATFSLVRLGKRPKVIWSGERGKAYLTCARDASGFMLAEYDKAGRGQKITGVKVFDAAGKEVSSYVPEKGRLVAALSGGKGLFIENAYEKEKGRVSTVLLRDKDGKVIGKAGPFGIREIEWSDDGSRLMVNIGRIGGGRRSTRGPSQGVLVVDMKTGKTLHKLPATYRAQMSRRGDLVTTAGDKQLVLWANGKKVKTFAPPSYAVFSPDGAYVGLRAGKECRVYRTKDWALTMTVKAPSGHTFGIDSASISRTGRLLIVTFVAERNAPERSNLVCLYESDGTSLWMRRFPWKDGRGTLRGSPSLLPDGKEAYIQMFDKVIRVAFSAK